ncbi:MAG: nicotinamide mononucleotide transporter [Pseudohongiella sp.]|nr:MAG: nicotinamide mononucleotide transporter [Pseudohongiella sp.]
MTDVLATVAQQFQQNTLLELTAVVFAVLYLLLAVKENILCWAAAIVSTSIYLFIFWDVKLYMESGLQIYYLGMAAYGWTQWNNAKEGAGSLPVSVWNLKQHALALSAIALLTFASGYLLNSGTDAQLPFVDSFTTWASVVTTFMVARKVLENWIYWLVIDSISIFLYLDRELYFTALLFAVYIVIIFFGWFSWLKSYRQQTKTA